MPRSGLRRGIDRCGGCGRRRISSGCARIGGVVTCVGGAGLRIGGGATRIGCGIAGAVRGAVRVGCAVARAGFAVTRVGAIVTRINGVVARGGVARVAAGSLRRCGSGSAKYSRRRRGSGPTSRSRACATGRRAGPRATCGAMPRGDFGTVPPPRRCHQSLKSMSF